MEPALPHKLQLGLEPHLQPRPNPTPAPLQEAADLTHDIAPQAASEAAWACEVLGLPTPPPLAAAALGAPFRLHVRVAAAALGGDEGGHVAREGGGAPAAAAAAAAGSATKKPRSAKRARSLSKQSRAAAASGTGGTGAASGAVAAAEAAEAAEAALEAVTALVAELPLRRDEIASGSAAPSQERLLEDRATCWLSDSGHAFDYSGKRMAPAGPLSGRTAAVRRRVERGHLAWCHSSAARPPRTDIRPVLGCSTHWRGELEPLRPP